MANIIFDFDGTIADTFDLIVDVSYKITGVKRLPAGKIRLLRGLPILEAIQRLGGSPWHIPKLLIRTRPMMRERMAEVPVFRGVEEMLTGLQAMGHRLFILSSNEASNVDLFLERHGLTPYFEVIYTVPYGNAWFKARALRKVMRRLKLDPSASFYIGNEPLDVHAAQKVGIHSVAVTWSGQNDEELVEARPDYVVTKPKELTEFFS